MQPGATHPEQQAAETDIAIVHDQFRTMGGAERVACELARTFDAPIYAGRVDDGVPPADVEMHELFDGRVGRRAMRAHYLIQDAYQMLAWQQAAALREYDTLLVNKTNPLWFVPREQQTVVAYVHSTPRGMYDVFARTQRGLAARAFTTAMRTLYETNRTTPDAIACNSELVKRRLDLYWDRDDATVIYPPVETRSFGAEHGVDAEYIFAISRLRPHKRVDALIAAARSLDREVVIAGEGPERKRLEAEAPDNVTFVGYVSEAEKRRYLAEAAAVWFGARNEDFGIVPIEAFASGTPVIGVAEGFTTHQILDGKNGLLYDHSRDGLLRALKRFDREGVAWDSERIEAFAERFDTAEFRSQMYEFVRGAAQSTGTSAPWEQQDVGASDAETLAAGVETDGGGVDE